MSIEYGRLKLNEKTNAIYTMTYKGKANYAIRKRLNIVEARSFIKSGWIDQWNKAYQYRLANLPIQT